MLVQRDMVGPSYKENEKLIFWERKREKKKLWGEKADGESMETASWLLRDKALDVGLPVIGEWLW